MEKRILSMTYSIYCPLFRMWWEYLWIPKSSKKNLIFQVNKFYSDEIVFTAPKGYITDKLIFNR